MSGTAFGTIVLHVTPESAVGGPLAHVHNGDRITLSVARRELTLQVSDEELARRARLHPVTEPTAERGYRKLFLTDRKSTRLNSSHLVISYAVFCLKKKNTSITHLTRH